MKKTREIEDYWPITPLARKLDIKRETLVSAVKRGDCPSRNLANGTPIVHPDDVRSWAREERRPGRKPQAV